MSSGDKARQLLSGLVGVPMAQIPENAAVGSFSGWDSIVHMELIVTVESRLGRELSEEEMLAISTISGLSNVLGAGDAPQE